MGTNTAVAVAVAGGDASGAPAVGAPAVAGATRSVGNASDSLGAGGAGWAGAALCYEPVAIG